MRTTQSLLKAEKYLDGSPIYKGDINRVHASQFVYRIEASVVKAPDGARLFTESDDTLLRTMHKLKFGQIGALKSGEVEISGSEILFEVVVPVKAGEVIPIKEKLLTIFNSEEYMKAHSCMVKGNPIKLDKLKDSLEKYRDGNREIRQRWVQKAKDLRSRGASPEDIKLQKQKAYAEYCSISEYSVAVSVHLTHIVNNPSLKSTVNVNIGQQYYDAVNYKESKVRKSADYVAPIVSIPVSTLENYVEVLNYFSNLKTKSPTILELQRLGLEEVYNEASKLNSTKIDFASLKKHDQTIK
jgi:hypothetical protein